MALWLVKRTDDVGYDEYDGLVVRARDEAEVRSIVHDDDTTGIKTYSAYAGSFRRREYTVEELQADGESGVILDSFNAG